MLRAPSMSHPCGNSLTPALPTLAPLPWAGRYVFDAAVNNAGVVTVPRLDGFKIDVEGGWLWSAAIGTHKAMIPSCTCCDVGRAVAAPQQCSPADSLAAALLLLVNCRHQAGGG